MWGRIWPPALAGFVGLALIGGWLAFTVESHGQCRSSGYSHVACAWYVFIGR